jgi:hypothetical protein
MDIVGIDLDQTGHLRPDILAEQGAPMLEHGIKKLAKAKAKVWVLTAPGEKLGQAQLEVRFEEFSGQATIQLVVR